MNVTEKSMSVHILDNKTKDHASCKFTNEERRINRGNLDDIPHDD